VLLSLCLLALSSSSPFETIILAINIFNINELLKLFKIWHVVCSHDKRFKKERIEMFDPLNLATQTKHLVQLSIDNMDKYFICKNIENITHLHKSNTVRYHLQDMDNNQNYILELHKDKNQNFHIHYYKLLEQKPYSHVFISILGTQSIGYQLKTDKNEHFGIYNIVTNKNEKLTTYKYIADIDDLEKHPSFYGYKKDANNNWYILMQKSKGILKNFTNNQIKRSWTYQQATNTLLIEIDEKSKQEKKYFDIFHGKALKRTEIKLIPWLQKNETNKLQELLRNETSIY